MDGLFLTLALLLVMGASGLLVLQGRIGGGTARWPKPTIAALLVAAFIALVLSYVAQ